MSFFKRLKYGKDSYLVTLLIVAIALMLNYIASRHFFRVDLTHNQLYAVSDSSKSFMKSLDDIVTIQVVFSEPLPPNLSSVKQYLQDVLDELSSYAGGNLFVEFLDPEKPEVRNEAERLGIPQVQMNIVEKDKLEVKNGFLGVAITYGDKTEVLPVVQNILNVEYDLIAAIKKVTAETTNVVGFVSGHAEPPLDQPVEVGSQGSSFSLLKRALDRNYLVKIVDLNKKDDLSGVNSLLVAGPKNAFTDDEKINIDHFLTTGGDLIFMIDPLSVGPDLEVSENDLSLKDLFLHYGFEVDSSFVLDHSNEQASFNQGYANFVVPYPFWVKSLNKSFDSDNPIVNKLDSVIFPWASPVRINQSAGILFTKLIQTTEGSWKQVKPFNLDPNSIQGMQSKEQYPLAVLAEGDFGTFSDVENVDSKHDNGRILIIGNSRFATDRFVRMFDQNLAFIMNAVDYLTLDESLIEIRSKSSFDLPLKDLSVRERQVVKFFGIFLIPLLVVFYGLFRYFLRRKNNVIS